MVDLETGGTSPDETPILQIAAVRFNVRDRTVDANDMFNRCLAVPPKRYWDEGTRDWWLGQKQSVLMDILRRAEDPAKVMGDFRDWAGTSPDEPHRFWAKPISFDYAFVSSYFRQFKIYNPFHYRYAIDVNSFLRGLTRSGDLPVVEVEFQGDAHNALFDVLHQISVVFKGLEEVYPDVQGNRSYSAGAI